jgi:hypothetical protein
VQSGQLSPDLAFPFGDSLGHVDLNQHVKIAAFPGNAWQTAFAKAKSLASLGARRNF